MRPLRPAWLLGGSLALLLLGLGLSLTQGAVSLPLADTLSTLAAGPPTPGTAASQLASIVWGLRVPRTLLGLLVGGCLGASGAAMQGLFRNPLADPYLLGTASGASLGATLALTAGSAFVQGAAVGLGTLGSLGLGRAWVSLSSFVGALLSVLLTLTLAGPRGRRQGTPLLLAGFAVGSLLTACTSYFLLRDAQRTREVLAWTLGGLSWASVSDLLWLAPQALLGLGALLALGRVLDALSLGEDTARTLFPRLPVLRLAVIAASSLLTAGAVSCAGAIGFLGLVAPHIQRRLGATRHHVLLPASALLGGALLLLADVGARVLDAPTELPVGLLTTLLGGPFFLALLRRRP